MKILKALEFAKLKHEGQVRKVSNEPYFSHPLIVSYLLVSFKDSKNLDDLICASLLHDTLEDTDTTFEEIAKEFGPLVANIVYELTSDKDEIEKIGKKEYLMKKMIHMSSYALTIKLVDRLSNVMDSPTAQTKKDTKEILEAIIKNRVLTATQHKIIFEINKYIGVEIKEPKLGKVKKQNSNEIGI